MSLFQGPGRRREFLRFLAAVCWLLLAYFLAEKAGHGFSRGLAFPLIRNIFDIFLLVIGYGYMELSWENTRQPLRAMGLGRGPGCGREFALGAALGWAMVAVVILIVALAGHLYIQLWIAPAAWGRLVLQLLVVATVALAEEIAFRGYAFQKLVAAVGPFAATLLAGLFFGLVRVQAPGTTSAAVWVSGMAAILLSVAYLQTHRLWLCWGLHFAWLAAIGILFGQPLAGSRTASTVIQTYADGPTWLTGAEYGPEASVITLLVLWIGLYFLFRITRDLAWKVNQPVLKPAGIPMDLSHPMHPAPPPSAASVAVQPAPASGLVQIAPAVPPPRQAPPEPVVEPVVPQPKE
ncbi:MAG TPA: type II CAAX endopeptidase family protein [Acidobacteriaceae bacterium]|nr:type II CAAX endopeptidase family protein [Acidobacteriaceae bacterium]